MDSLREWILALDSVLGSAAYFPYILLGTGLFFTLYLGFPQIRFFNHAWKVLRGKGKFDHSKEAGDTSHFQALATALSGTVGTGNIGGVAFAIYLGGPAALFWMWVTAFLGMTTKFVEVTLSHKYRVKTSDGTMAGGPMYFMDRRLNMKWLAVTFAVGTVICSFGTGNMPQINTIAQGMESSFGVEPAVTGGVLTVLLALVILGGIKRIAAVTSKVVPVMAVFYVIGAIAVIAYNIENLLPAFVSVFSDAFTGSAAAGGFLGASFAYAFNRGVNRGLYSNEAGQGSAPIAHASARADEPVSEGLVSILEPFIDTILICTLTGMVILSSGVWTQKYQNTFDRSDMSYLSGAYSDQINAERIELGAYLNGRNSNVESYSGTLHIVNGVSQTNGYTLIAARSVAEDVLYRVGGSLYTGALTVKNGRLQTPKNGDETLLISVSGKSLVHSAKLTTIAFNQGYLGDYGQYIVSIGLLLFAFSTAIAWSYYGDRAVTYLFGIRAVMPYRVLYMAGFFWASVADTTLIWDIAAVAIVVMTLPNLFGILLLHKEMKETVKDYWQKFER